MAYAALLSLKHTIERLRKSSHISLVPPSPKIIEFAYRQVQSLELALKELDRSSSGRKRLNPLDRQIREAVSKFEDVLEFHVSEQIDSQSGRRIRPSLLSVNLQDLKQEIQSFTEAVTKMEEEYVDELYDAELDEEEDDDDANSLKIHFGRKKSKMVGLSDELREIKKELTRYQDYRLEVYAVLGMSGIGKTALSREIFEDPDIQSYFECRAWVTVGTKCKIQEIRRAILAQVIESVTEKMLPEGDEKIAQYLQESLDGKRYLIVLDDVWEMGLLHDLKSLFPDDKNGSKFLLTTRLQKVAEDAVTSYSNVLKTRLLNKEESWDLLRERVFAEQVCPDYQLEKAGKKIAEICEGLPLTIVAVADLLSKAEKTSKYWSEITADKEHSLLLEAYDEMLKVISPTYEYLPQHLKACFLYMGVFPQNYQNIKTLLELWIYEGFIEPAGWRTIDSLEHRAMDCFRIVSDSLHMVHEASTKFFHIHSSLQHLLRKEAWKNKFFHMLSTRADGSAEGIQSQCRLSIHNNILFGIKEVYDSMEKNCASTARSLLCFGPYHQYPVPICFGLRLLRVLDALAIRFYDFPAKVLKLVQLRYLALTCNGKLPASISKLRNLRYLVVRRHLTIKSCGVPSYLPTDIWDMKELRHLQVMGSDLPNPCGSSLQDLTTLLDTSPQSCTDGILKAVPNLEKLGIQIELVPDDAGESLRWFDHISHLKDIKTLKCVVVNPEQRSKIVATPALLSNFPSRLKKLSLSGLGYPWEEMSKIALLPNLEVLKLRNYAFRGPKWEVEENRFLNLRFLLVEDSNLVQWKFGDESFRWLSRLSLKHCYKLEKIDGKFGYGLTVELVDCNPLAFTCVKEVHPEAD